MEKHFVSLLLNHPINSHPHELGGDASTSVLGAGGQHGDVASHGPAAVGLEFADDDSDDVVIFVQGLRSIINSPCWYRRFEEGHTMKHKSPH
jgi:hypothetical protein